MLQLLNLDKILETEARESAEKRAIRNGINVGTVNGQPGAEAERSVETS